MKAPTQRLHLLQATGLLAIFILFVPLPGHFQQTQRRASHVSVTGHFVVVQGDGFPGVPLSPQTTYWLLSDEGQTYRLAMDEQLLSSAGGSARLMRQHVRLEISAIPMALEGGGAASYQVFSITLEPLASETNQANLAPVSSVVSGSQRWASILCKFSDVTAEPKDLAYFQNMFSGAFPGLDHYWRELSYNLINVYGSTATGWYVLPHPRSYYVYNGALDFERAVNDCTAVADASLYFPDYVGINLMFNDELDGYAWGGYWYLTLDGVSRYWDITWEPPWGYENITAMAHEMGHGFGLPHSSGMYGYTYDNVWDVMSDAWANCSLSSDSTYGCLGQHTIAYHKALLGWIPAEKKYTVPFNSTPSNQTLSGSFLMAQIPRGTSTTDFYTVEVRARIGYDVKLPGQAVIIHQVQTTRERPAQVVDIDNNGNTGDAGAMWTVGETFQDTVSSISVEVLASSGTMYQVRIRNGLNTVTLWLEPLSQLVSVFYDVSGFHWARSWIDRIYNAGITSGCRASPLQYCPNDAVTRAQMAVFLLKALYGASYTPPNVSPTFSDTAGHWAEDWIEALKATGITSGYPDGTYRPDNPVTRAEMAVFLLKALHGDSYTPPNVSPTFSDTAGHWAEDWIEALKAAGITSGYPDGTYRPNNPVTRAEMAVFLVKAFNLP